MKNLDYKETWSGTYNGLRFEIIRWEAMGLHRKEKRWNYYIFPEKRMFTKAAWKKIAPRSERDYIGRLYMLPHKSSLDRLCWHGGLTFLEATKMGVKAGCDYAHAFDVGVNYKVEDLYKDMCRTVDALVAAHPDILRQCRGDGKMRPRTDFEDGSDISIPYKEAREKYRRAESRIPKQGGTT